MTACGSEAAASRSAASSSTFPSLKLSHSQHYVRVCRMSHREKLAQHIHSQVLREQCEIVDGRFLALLEATVDGDEKGGVHAILFCDGEVRGNCQRARHVLSKQTDGARREDPKTIDLLLEDEVGGGVGELEPVNAAVDVELREREGRDLQRECACGRDCDGRIKRPQCNCRSASRRRGSDGSREMGWTRVPR